jgi:hypothetical protein
MALGNKLLMAGALGLGVWYFVKKTRASSLQPAESYPEAPTLEQIFSPGGADATTTVDATSSSGGSGSSYTADSMGSGTGASTTSTGQGQAVGASSTDTTADKQLAQALKNAQQDVATNYQNQVLATFAKDQAAKKAADEAAAEFKRMEAAATASRLQELTKNSGVVTTAHTGSSLPEDFGAPTQKATVGTAKSTLTETKTATPLTSFAKAGISTDRFVFAAKTVNSKQLAPAVGVASYTSPITGATKTVTASPKTVMAMAKVASVDKSRSQVGDGIAKAATTVKAPAVALRAPMQAMRGVYAIRADLTEAEYLAAAAKARLETSRREWAANQLAETIAGLTYGR